MEIGGFLVTASNVSTADGLLGMDFLHAADAWIGARNGTLHMTWGRSVLTYKLMSEYPSDFYTVNVIEKAVIQAHSHHMLKCKVDFRDEEVDHGGGHDS